METIDVTLKVPAPGQDTLYLFDNISSSSALSVVKDIQTLDKQLLYFDEANIEKIKKFIPGATFKSVPRRPINIILNTGGGYCYDGFAICNTIEEITNRRDVNIHVSGLVASMGIPVLLSTSLECRSASKNTTFMIHQVLGAAFGKVADVEVELEEMKRIQKMIWKIIAANSKITMEQLQDCYDHKRDWFISAEEALEFGLISKIV